MATSDPSLPASLAEVTGPQVTFDCMKVIQGTCGWTDQSLIKCGKFYPKKSAKSSERLEFYSRQGGFGCVEVDCSTYAIQHPDAVQSWVSATPKVMLVGLMAMLLALLVLFYQPYCEFIFLI